MELLKLFEEIKKGDKNSFKKLYGKVNKEIYLYALKLTEGDKNLAHEAVADCFLKIWENRNKIKIHSSLKHYLFLTTRNNVIDHYRKQKLNIVELSDDYEVASLENSNDDDSDYSILYEELHKLPCQSLRILELAVFESLSYKEIALKLQISVNTVKTHIYRAHRHLKKNLNNDS
ncbi:MAG: sigma-70 family RNA polymerase sigma factor [Prolixibacteraceae bacterium]|nr:sigma-70 family RNA polymerase sigma factor [Prolixibacteraceae bacterium]